MNLSKYKKWKALLHRVIAKQAKREDLPCVFTGRGKVRKSGEQYTE